MACPSISIDVHERRKRAVNIANDKITMGMMWSAHVEDVCFAFGMEVALKILNQKTDML